MPATELNITIEQGANYSLAVSAGVAHDGKSCRASIYDRFGGRLLATFACSTVNTAGITTITLTAAQTEAILAPANVRDTDREIPIGVWDLEAISGSNVARAVIGIARLRRLGRIR